MTGTVRDEYRDDSVRSNSTTTAAAVPAATVTVFCRGNDQQFAIYKDQRLR